MEPSLLDKLSQLPGKYHRSTIKNVALLLTLLIQSRTVNLNHLKDDAPACLPHSRTHSESHYKRLTRFFSRYSRSRLFMDLLLGALKCCKQKIEYAMVDATEWKIGKLWVHVLVLAIDYRGVALPIFFKVYRHKGCLSEKERIKFIRKAQSVFHLHSIVLLADREFIGKEWLGWLNERSIRFLIRIKKGIYQLDNQAALERKALKKGYAQGFIDLQGYTYRIEYWASGEVEEPLVYLISNVLEKKRMGKAYARRWKIECCFKHFKSNGFKLEEVNMSDLYKIRLLIALIIFAYILIIEQTKKEKNVPMKNYANRKRYRAVSVFRTGMATLKARVYNVKTFLKYLAQLKLKKHYILQFVQ